MTNNTNLTQQTISLRRFSLADQINFSSFSGDTNPIHVDAIAARRTIAGQCIVHGMHSLLWALDALAKINITAIELKVRFLKPIFLDEDIKCIWNEETNQISLQADDTTLAIISLIPGKVVAENIVLATIEHPRNKPNEPTFFDCSKLSQQPFKIHGDTTLAQELFPSLCRLYGLAIVCEIAAISQVLGMECPGLHSLFASLQLHIKSNNNLFPAFSVVQSDERFNLLRISVEGHTVCGEIEAFYRPSPTRNLTISALAAHVRKNEFENVCALIVGGSRGLGELVAKLIAAGGGKPIITYNVGQIEAEQLTDEIRAYGGQCTAFQLTVNSTTTLPSDLPNFNQLYYFATPRIFGKRSTDFDDALFSKFLEIYVNGFDSICNQIIAQSHCCSVLYPSTIAIDQPLFELAEYAKAKAQGELLCEAFNSKRLLRILTPRLPRMATDQTQSLVKVNSEDPIEIVLPLLREML